MWGPSNIYRRRGVPTANAKENRPERIWCDPVERSTVEVVCSTILSQSRRASLLGQARDCWANAVSKSRSREHREARWTTCRPEPDPSKRSILYLCNEERRRRENFSKTLVEFFLFFSEITKFYAGLVQTHLLVCREAPTFCGEKLSLHASMIFFRTKRHSRNIEKNGWCEIIHSEVKEWLRTLCKNIAKSLANFNTAFM